MPPTEPHASLRRATAADQGVVRRMVNQAGLDPTYLHWQNFIIAELEGEVVGIGQVRPYRRCRELGSLVVRADMRGRGIARMVIEALLAEEQGPVYLECAARLAALYRRFGFEEIAWQHAPLPLKLKAGLVRLLGWPIVVMRRPGPAERVGSNLPGQTV